MGGFDYDKILSAYQKVNVQFFYTITEEHALPILAQSIHDMSSEELILRQSAFRLLLSFIEFSAEILNRSPKSDLIWSEVSIQHIVHNFFLKYMGNAMDKEGAVKKVWIDLLRQMVLKLPKVANLGSYGALCSDDAEQDFFNNIVHLQKHRRARALSRFRNIVISGSLSEAITKKVFIPLLFSMLFDVQDGKDEHIRSGCIDALASISGCMKWNQYYALLMRCFRDLTLKPDKQKLLLRLICSILDQYHFSESSLVQIDKNVSACVPPDPYADSLASSLTLRKCTNLLNFLSYRHLCAKIYSQDSKSITFKTQALKLLFPVTAHLHKQLTQKMKLKLETMLSSIAAGIECNPSVNQTDLFIFTHCLIKDGINDETNDRENSCASMNSELGRDDERDKTRLVNVDRRFSHLITAFALGVLQNFMKTLKLNREDEQLCLPPLVRLPLPSLESQADNIKNSLLVIAQGSVNASSQLTESCIKLLTALLRSTRVTLSADQLHMLIQFPMFVDFAKNPSFAALSLLKAIVHRKLVVPEIYDIVQIVAELMVQSQLEPIRKKCSQILLQFLLGYHLSEKRLQQHLDFLLANLRYEHSTGREAALEMLHAIILKFPRNIIDAQSQTMFVHLVVSLANDDDSKVRSMTAAAIKCLIGHVNTDSLHSILEYSLSWYLGGNHNLWSAAAQVLGLLVEVMRKSFEKHLSRVLPVLRNILQSALSSLTSIQQNSSHEAVASFWKEAYYSLVLLEKLLCQFHNLFFDREFESLYVLSVDIPSVSFLIELLIFLSLADFRIWETICEFLLHPHLWLRNISNRILSVYFAAVTTACRDKEVSMGTFFLMKPSILFHVAVSLSCQLKVPLIDDAAGVIILQNLVFSICGLHSLLVDLEFVDVLISGPTLNVVSKNVSSKLLVPLIQEKEG
ncbi:UNVERIFIED_CONTAM: Small subunit processome component 20 [Sesamum radiatum]|uniref:Small subunit processome component 20 n=1 Tax=Sesamum radiatum TaxID=300843 RepID=A0AAW2QFS4_SESRA